MTTILATFVAALLVGIWLLRSVRARRRRAHSAALDAQLDEMEADFATFEANYERLLSEFELDELEIETIPKLKQPKVVNPKRLKLTRSSKQVTQESTDLITVNQAPTQVDQPQTADPVTQVSQLVLSEPATRTKRRTVRPGETAIGDPSKCHCADDVLVRRELRQLEPNINKMKPPSLWRGVISLLKIHWPKPKWLFHQATYIAGVVASWFRRPPPIPTKEFLSKSHAPNRRAA